MLVQVKNHNDRSSTWWNPAHHANGTKVKALNMVLSLSGRVSHSVESKAWKPSAANGFVRCAVIGTTS
ncbi:hypothetical protein [Magnetospira sp. QH-2]|uniref:hypothetical protein n=1 Tax=Magnetospira sp. (strain QH-2) TaxID=1288970 RepID=UPI0003E8106D|nr:hypothetical protein [Magnetospira sp. QH-2]CCQ74876.1 protein of unknown function [Magnetospira sp. QH-2]